MRDWKQGSGSGTYHNPFRHVSDRPPAADHRAVPTQDSLYGDAAPYGEPNADVAGQSHAEKMAEIARLATDLRAIEARLFELRQTVQQSATQTDPEIAHPTSLDRPTVNPNAVAAEQLLHRYLRSR